MDAADLSPLLNTAYRVAILQIIWDLASVNGLLKQPRQERRDVFRRCLHAWLECSQVHVLFLSSDQGGGDVRLCLKPRSATWCGKETAVRLVCYEDLRHGVVRRLRYGWYVMKICDMVW